MKIMGETIEDMDKELEPKDMTITFLTDKIRISREAIKQMENLLTEVLGKTDRVRKKLDETLEKHKQINW